jgi:hypothetical protein
MAEGKERKDPIGPTPQPLRVAQIYAEAIKRLHVVDIRPDPGEPIVLLTGKNRQGKSSIVEAIIMAIAGEKHVPEQAVHQGEERGEVILDFGDFFVQRVITDKGSTLSVIGKDGGNVPSPQTFLNERLGFQVQNPLEFLRLSKEKQVAHIQGLINLKPDTEEFGKRLGVPVKEKDLEDPIAAFDSSLVWLYDRRAEINSQAGALAGVLKEWHPTAEDYTRERIDLAAVLEEKAELERIAEGNKAVLQEYESHMAYRKKLEVERGGNIALIQDLKRRLASAKQDAERINAEIVEEEAAIQEYDSKISSFVPPDFSSVNEKLNSLEANNRKWEKTQEWRKTSEKHAELSRTSATLTERMQMLKEYKEQLISQANLPIEGLSFEGGSITYKGFPLSQASTAEQIAVSCAVCMASHPEIGLLTVDRGWSELDQESQDALREWAGKIGCHVVVTQVAEEPGNKGWHLVEGAVVAVNGEPAPAPEKPEIKSKKVKAKKSRGPEFLEGVEVPFTDLAPPAFMQATSPTAAPPSLTKTKKEGDPS